MLTREAWNALLKILEEPPPRRRVRLRHHRAAEDRHDRGAGAVPAAALRLPPHRARPPSGTGSRQVLGAEGIDGRRRRAGPDRAPRRRRHARRPVAARPVPELRRGRRHRRAGARGARAGGGRARTPRCCRSWSERDGAGVFPLVDRLLDSGADLGEFMNGAGRDAARAADGAGRAPSPRGSPSRCAQPCWSGIATRLEPGDIAAHAAAARRERDRRSGGAAMRGWWWRRCCCAGRCWTGWWISQAVLRRSARSAGRRRARAGAAGSRRPQRVRAVPRCDPGPVGSAAARRPAPVVDRGSLHRRGARRRPGPTSSPPAAAESPLLGDGAGRHRAGGVAPPRLDAAAHRPGRRSGR